MKIETASEQLDVEIIGGGSKPTPPVLFLHGAGASDKNRARYIADDLMEKGYSSILFDFSGQGESSGCLKQSSLSKREGEAMAVVESLKLSTVGTIIGSSMGAHTAIGLAGRLRPHALILICPAVYDHAVYSLQFDSGFSEGIRRSESWRDSDAFELLSQFQGNLLIIIGSQDQVIPKDLPNLLYTAAAKSSQREIMVIENADHQIHTWLRSHPGDQRLAIEKISSYIS